MKLGTALLVGVGCLACQPVHAQSYPTQDVHVIVGFAPGSGPDITARFLSDKLQQKFGKPFLVENKPGAVGNIATEYVARARPDGHTIYVTGGSALVASAYLFKNPPVDVTTFEIIATLASAPILMVIAADSPHKTLADLTKAVRAKGDKASYGTAFPTARVLGALYRDDIGSKAVEVQYRTSADWVNDLNSGSIDFGFVDSSSGVGMAKAGRFRVLAITTAQRSNALPEYPTMAEAGGPKVDLKSWWAAFAPAGTPNPVLLQLNSAMSAVVSTEDAKHFFNATGNDTWVTTPEEARAYFLKDYKDWGEYVKRAKIEPQG
jgi:tripartite-type tricarboxylate transporter receptor subunit TctC